MRILLIAILFMMHLNAMAQGGYTVSKDSVDGGKIFKGPLTFGELKKESSFTWLPSGYEAYRPAAASMAYLRQHLAGYTILVFLGTWCDDSHNLIPKLEKVLDEAGYPQQQLTMYGVDRAKTTGTGEEKAYNIKLVPAIILMKDGKEAGRITETVNNSMEADLAAIAGYHP